MRKNDFAPSEIFFCYAPGSRNLKIMALKILVGQAVFGLFATAKSPDYGLKFDPDNSIHGDVQ